LHVARHLGRPGALPRNVLEPVRGEVLRRRRRQARRRGLLLAARPRRRRDARQRPQHLDGRGRARAGRERQGRRGGRDRPRRHDHARRSERGGGDQGPLPLDPGRRRRGVSRPYPEHWSWRDGPVVPGSAVVIDLDGVLSDAASRQHYLEAPDRDWRAFFDACGDDPVIEEVKVLLDLLDASLAIVLLTARPERVHLLTEAWLHRYKIRWDVLVMRPWGDFEV